LLNDNFEAIGKVSKAVHGVSDSDVEGTFPGLEVQTIEDIGKTDDEDSRFILKWETLNKNRDKPRQKPWPKASRLYLYKIRKDE